MDLFVICVVDQVTGSKQVDQLADGWMGWESKTLKRLRALGAKALVALAARLDSNQQRDAIPATPAHS